MAVKTHSALLHTWSSSTTSLQACQALTDSSGWHTCPGAGMTHTVASQLHAHVRGAARRPHHSCSITAAVCQLQLLEHTEGPCCPSTPCTERCCVHSRTWPMNSAAEQATGGAVAGCLCPLAPDAPGKLDVLGHDGHTAHTGHNSATGRRQDDSEWACVVGANDLQAASSMHGAAAAPLPLVSPQQHPRPREAVTVSTVYTRMQD